MLVRAPKRPPPRPLPPRIASAVEAASDKRSVSPTSAIKWGRLIFSVDIAYPSILNPQSSILNPQSSILGARDRTRLLNTHRQRAPRQLEGEVTVRELRRSIPRQDRFELRSGRVVSRRHHDLPRQIAG